MAPASTRRIPGSSSTVTPGQPIHTPRRSRSTGDRAEISAPRAGAARQRASSRVRTMGRRSETTTIRPGERETGALPRPWDSGRFAMLACVLLMESLA